MASGTGKACVVGIGQTELSRNSGRSITRLALEALFAAADDAGIAPSMIDGFVPYPDSVTAEDVIPVLGGADVRFTAVSHMGGASSLAGLRLATLAVESGQADFVAVFVARNGSSATRIDQRVRQLTGQAYRRELEYPHGMNTPAQWYALACRRHMHEFGTTREALGTVALTMRENAQRNPGAQMYGRKLTMDDYLSAPVIADPYLKYDCCLETDGAAAVIVAREDRLADSRVPGVRIEGIAEGHPDSADDIAGRWDIFNTGLTKAAPRAFGQAGLTPADVDLAYIYDCFTFEVIQQLEEAGFCGRGEGGDFVLDGNIAAGGSLPVNTHGGLLSEGHLTGMNHLVECVRQLRHQAPDGRQVADARVAALTGWGDMGDGALALLAKA
ncbi:lipid-transfer protein [Streptomyces leeuwenhoekii]|uniref:thiolase C-terminal domain-containing protein n=1 Tax=Streptomyces leeuwenhoekii TaxID=1437453 RepID=UPI0036C40D77